MSYRVGGDNAAGIPRFCQEAEDLQAETQAHRLACESLSSLPTHLSITPLQWFLKPFYRPGGRSNFR